MHDYVICVRNVQKGEFGAEPGATTFLKVPAAVPKPTPAHKVAKKKTWFDAVIREAVVGQNTQTGRDYGDILVFIHGYNNNQEIVMQRHRRIKKDLAAVGYQGAVVSFDWPSDERALNYLEDRSDAKQTALKLVDDCIKAFAIMQSADCETNVHLLAHSTGAYVIREAFDDADDRPKVAETNWTVSQIMFIGADVSARSLSRYNAKSSSIFRHCIRFTNYSNTHDSVLKISNVKRAGVAPRVGRVGLPPETADNAVNVFCGDYYVKHEDDMTGVIGTKCHSWHIGDMTFARDMHFTISGDIDRHAIPTRGKNEAGQLILKG